MKFTSYMSNSGEQIPCVTEIIMFVRENMKLPVDRSLEPTSHVINIYLLLTKLFSGKSFCTYLIPVHVQRDAKQIKIFMQNYISVLCKTAGQITYISII